MVPNLHGFQEFNPEIDGTLTYGGWLFPEELEAETQPKAQTQHDTASCWECPITPLMRAED